MKLIDKKDIKYFHQKIIDGVSKHIPRKFMEVNNKPETYPSCWNEDGTVWTQPPVKISHGDLVEVNYNGQTLLGRYIGKGMGVVELYNYASGVSYHVDKVISRGLDRNPRLISDENLLKFIND